MKTFLIFSIIVSATMCVKAQEILPKEFGLSFMKLFKYPNSLKESCKPTLALIKISKKENSLQMVISDSADSLFKKEFYRISEFLNKEGIGKLIKSNGDLLIPVHYVYDLNYCKGLINANELTNFTRFDGKYYSGRGKFFEPIIVTTYKPVVN